MVFLKRVVIENFKSIAYCDVELGPLTYLVGPNGAGKTNFLQALGFVSDALPNDLFGAMKDRGFLNGLLHSPFGLYRPLQTQQQDRILGIGLEFVLPSGQTGHYAFRLKLIEPNSLNFEIEDEVFFLSKTSNQPETYFQTHQGKFIHTNVGLLKQFSQIPATLVLFLVSGLDPFREVYTALTQMRLYDFNNLAEFKKVQSLVKGETLSNNGRDLASVVNFLEKNYPEAKERIENYLMATIPTLQGIHVIPLRDRLPKEVVQGPQEALLVFEQISPNDHIPTKPTFAASAMSDGTLRTLGILTALFQTSLNPVTVVCIDEPELYLHPAAAAVLREAMEEASLTKQVIVTCHSPDILDDHTVNPDSILAVISDKGASHIGPLSKGGMTVLKDHLFTPGELLRMDQLTPTMAVPDTRTNLFDLEVKAQ